MNTVQKAATKTRPLVQTPLVFRMLPCTYVIQLRVGELETPPAMMHIPHQLVSEYKDLRDGNPEGTY
jgi:hypothetical protein